MRRNIDQRNLSHFAYYIVKSNNGESDAETALLPACRNDTTVSFRIYHRDSRVKVEALVLLHPGPSREKNKRAKLRAKD